jgi:hypothetical protein
MRFAIRPAVLLLFATCACMPRGPVLDTGPEPQGVGGTISGVVSASGGTTPLAGRKVTAVDLKTGERHETSTAVNGGYTLKVPQGRYRLEVELREGESLAKSPADTEINASDMDADRDFVVTVKAGS